MLAEGRAQQLDQARKMLSGSVRGWMNMEFDYRAKFDRILRRRKMKDILGILRVTLVDGEGADARKSEVTFETAVLTLFDHFDRLAIAKTPFALRVEFPLCDEVVRVHARGTYEPPSYGFSRKKVRIETTLASGVQNFVDPVCINLHQHPKPRFNFSKCTAMGGYRGPPPTTGFARLVDDDRTREEEAPGGQQMRRDGNDYGERFDDDPICMQEVLECFCVCLSLA